MPNAYAALFLYSEGVAAGRAIITARQSLPKKVNLDFSIEKHIHSQDVQDNVKSLQTCEDLGAQTTDYRV